MWANPKSSPPLELTPKRPPSLSSSKMAPKNKSLFRQPGVQHYQLVHRSQRDPLINDPDAGGRVLKSMENPNRKVSSHPSCSAPPHMPPRHARGIGTP